MVMALAVASCGGGGDSSSESATTTSSAAETTAALTTAAPVTAAPPTTEAAPEREPTWFDQVEAGQCFNDVFDDAGDFDFHVPPAIVDCNVAHDNEVILTVALTGGELRGDDVVGPEALDACETAFVDFLGARQSDNVLVDAWAVFPTEEFWDVGIDWAICGVHGEELIGTAASGSLTAPGETLAVIGQLDDTSGV
jgi:hypothetical protein